MEQSLACLKVLDATHYIAGPFCTKLLADYGAEVIKVEKPIDGDPSRWLGPFPADKPDPEASGLFLYLNANKRSITLDLRTAEGVKSFKELVKYVDVVVENFEPRVMPSLGLDYATLAKINPKLVMTSISNFGQSLPYRDYKATEIVEQAISGVLHVIGPYDQPMKLGDSPMQFTAGFMGALATLTAVWVSNKYGIGQHVDLSIMEAVESVEHFQIAGRYAAMGVVPGREGKYPDFTRSLIPCKDGYLVAAYLAAMRATWDDFVLAVDVPELGNERLQTPEGRHANMAEIVALLVEGWKDRTKGEILKAAEGLPVLIAPVQDAADIMTCPQLEVRQFFIEVEHPRTGKIKYPGAPFKMTETPSQLRTRAPLLGEHNDEVHASCLIQPEVSVDNLGSGHQMIEESNRTPPLPLEGIRILDASMFFAIPIATVLLAVMGAEVIHIESCSHLDGTRVPSHGLLDNRPPERGFWNHSPSFYVFNLNKLGITLDLRQPKGREIFLELVRESDVVAENWAPRVMKNLGLEYSDLKNVKSDIIMISSSGYGHSGPYVNRASVAYVTEAMSGLASVTGPPGRPTRQWLDWPDQVAAVAAAYGILVALHYRERTGKGQWIDLSQYEVMLTTLPEMIMDYVMNGRIQTGRGNRHTNMAPHGCYRCRGDDRWVALAISTDEEWRSLCQVMGKPDLVGEERFTTASARLRHQDELDPIIETWTANQDNYEVMHKLQSAGVPAAPVLNGKDVLLDPHLKGRAYWKAITHTSEYDGRMLVRPYPVAPWRMSKTPGGARFGAPALGQHNEYVLGHVLGKSDAEISRLESEGIIGKDPLTYRLGAPYPVASDMDRGVIRGYDPNYLEILSKALGMELS